MRSKKYQKIEEERLRNEAAETENVQEAAKAARTPADTELAALTSDEAAAEAIAHGKTKKGLFVKIAGMKLWQKVLCGLIIAALLFGVGAYGFVQTNLNKVEKVKIDKKKLSCVDIDGYINILLLGVDARSMKKKDLEGHNTDCIIVVSINTETKRVNMISVYRDTYLALNGTNEYNKVNAAYAWGGAEGAITTLNQNLDLNIDNYVLFNFKVVSDLVNAVGGIEVNVEDYEIEELNKYTKETAKIIHQKKYQTVKEPGKQTLEGVQAVAYGRIRKGVGDDFKRTSRMRVVVKKVTHKLQDMKVSQLMEIMDMVLPQIQTSLSNNDMIGLAQRLTSYEFDQSIGYPYSVTTGPINGISYVIPTDLVGDAVRLHAEFFGQQDYQVSDRLQEIANGIWY